MIRTLYGKLINCIVRIKVRINLPNIGNNYIFTKNFTIIGGKHIYIKNDFHANDYLRLEAIESQGEQLFNPIIEIGEHVSVGKNVHIGAINSVIISDGVLLGSNILITDHQHGQTEKIDPTRPVERELISKGAVIIGMNVWIGDGVCVMPNVTIGENSVIGANSVVTKSIPPNCVAAGIPAKVIKMLNK